MSFQIILLKNKNCISYNMASLKLDVTEERESFSDEYPIERVFG